MPDISRLYDMFATEFDRDRCAFAGEEPYLGALIARLAPSARVLDLGCGTGRPVAQFFIERGVVLTGVDAAPAMIALCRTRFPSATWLEHDMRTLALDQHFDAIIAWDSFFHLRADDQRAMLPVFRAHAAARALLLFTSGPAAGEAIGSFHGHELYHASLDADEYRALLDAHGFDLLLHRANDPDCGDHTVWLAQFRGIRE